MRRQLYARPATSRRGSETNQSSEALFLILGVIVKPHGVRGEMRVRVLVHDLPQLEEVPLVYLGPEHQPHELQSIRFHQGNLLLKLAGCEDRIAADTLRGMEVRIQAEGGELLGPDEYYVHNLVGLEVVDDQGKRLGELVEVIVTGANDVYRVVGDQGDILLPAIKDVIRSVDIQGGEVRVHLLPGLC